MRYHIWKFHIRNHWAKDENGKQYWANTIRKGIMTILFKKPTDKKAAIWNTKQAAHQWGKKNIEEGRYMVLECFGQECPIAECRNSQ